MLRITARWSASSQDGLRALHLAFLLPAVAVTLGTYRPARRFTRLPLIATAATLLTPGFLVSSTGVMCDTMMLAFWVLAIVFLIGPPPPERYHLFRLLSRQTQEQQPVKKLPR